MQENSPLANRENSPLHLVGPGCNSRDRRRYTKARQIVQLAEDKYSRTGAGITYRDLIISGIATHKRQAQETLKRFKRKKFVFAVGDHRPQQYFPANARANIMKDLAKRKNSPLYPTGVDHSAAPLKSLLENQKSQNFLDILHALSKTHLYIHRLHLQISIDKAVYNYIEGITVKGNRAKLHQERIAKTMVTYMVYPSGTAIVTIACSNSPLRLESDSDLTIIFSYLGQVRDRLIGVLSDSSETIVPPITEWILKQCDVNKDVEVNDIMQLTLPDIQLKYVDRVFRLYVKSLEYKAVYRVEESMTVDFTLFEALQHIRAPTESVQHQLLEQQHELVFCKEMVMRLVQILVCILFR